MDIYAVIVIMIIAILLLVILNNFIQNKRINSEIIQNKRINSEDEKHMFDAKVAWNADIPKPIVFYIPDDKKVEYYKAYDKKENARYDVEKYETNVFWVLISEMIPELKTNQVINDWHKDLNHTVTFDVDNECAIKPCIIVRFGKRGKYNDICK